MSDDGVLLLGGNGFIGSALAQKLATQGRQVHLLSPHASDTTMGVHYMQGGLDDPAVLAKVLPLCRTVIHLASATTPGSSANSPTMELANLAPTARLLESLQAYPETHLVFFSSGGALYGNPQHLPVREEDPAVPLSYHGAGKLALESLIHAFRARGHAVTILRPSNAYGPWQPLKSGFGLIRTMLEHALNETPLEIWGDGENVRDFVYIDDVTDACSFFLALPDDNDTYNVGSGIGYSINQVHRLVEKITGTQIKIRRRPARGIDVRSIVLSNRKVETTLSWRPKTTLEDGIRLTWKWRMCQA